MFLGIDVGTGGTRAVLLLWVSAHEPEIVRHRLTGEFAMDMQEPAAPCYLTWRIPRGRKR